MREYETTFIVRAELSDDAVRQLSDRIKSVIERHNGAVLDFQIMGRQNLAYRIEKQAKGNYVFIDYTGDTAVVAEVERTLRLDEGILKFLTVKTGENVDAKVRLEEIRVRKEKLAEAMAAPAVAAEAASKSEEATEEVTEAIEENANA
ncbi:MAG: 30S ribosomal protein S6 [Deltaproteobacteria bacterium CG11_big_fil_rev_8_21_14_0_20_47_16]|nr:MAG: 30S ribosomal protein S6 [Deltaproteobacteria bacterium CG11_big_fil_rev_8_21_14_0_20_47_16]